MNSLESELNAASSELRAYVAELEQNCREYALMIQGANDGLWTYDVENDRYTVSMKDKQIFAFPQDEEAISLADWKKLLHPKDAGKAEAVLVNFLASHEGIYDSTYRLRCRDGSYRWVHSRGVAERDEANRVIRMAGSHTDITAKVDQEKRLYRLAYYDSRTGLPNRVKMRQDFAAIKKDNMAFVFIDVDDISYVNNVMGYDTGDRLMEELATLLSERYGAEHYVAKLETDQFGILLFECPDIAAEIGHLLAVIRQKPFLERPTTHITVSAGVSIYGKHGESFEELLRSANTALYCAKRDGKDQYQIYEPEMHSYAYTYVDQVKQIRNGLEQREFTMHYQPIVDAKTGTVAGVEALLRWEHPQRGLVSPAEFIPVAEGSRQMPDLERWILRAVYEQCQAWINQQKMPAFVSINLSARGLIEDDLVGYLTELTEQYGVDPAYIELEITETALLTNLSQTLSILNQLRHRGFVLSLDDFGIGYSSLHYLRSLPIAKVKLDRSFIATINKSDKDRLIVASIIELAHRMDLAVIAEGVETVGQDDLLRSLGCDFIQGYLYGKPGSIAK